MFATLDLFWHSIGWVTCLQFQGYTTHAMGKEEEGRVGVRDRPLFVQGV